METEKKTHVSRREILKQFKKKTPMQEVLSRFSHIVGQTRLEDGVADPGSLRYTRVINQYSPFNGDETNLTFYADIQYEDCDEEMLKDILLLPRDRLLMLKEVGLLPLELKVMQKDIVVVLPLQ